MEWVKKHKALTVVIVLVGLFVIGSIAGGSQQSQTNNQQPAQQEQKQPEQPKFDVATFYGKVENGMTKEQVVAVAGKDADSCTESEMAGFGKYEYCTWNGGFSQGAIASVNFKDGKVESKSKTGF